MTPDDDALAGVHAPLWDHRDAAGLGVDHGARRLRRLALLRKLAAAALAGSARDIGFARDDAGALRVVEPRPLFVSTAGREGWSVVAIGLRPIGVDIEAARPTGPLPVDLLTLRERARIDAAAPIERPAMFARLWTAKEAYAKATGRSLDEVLGLESRVSAGVLRLEGVSIHFRSRAQWLAAAALL